MAFLFIVAYPEVPCQLVLVRTRRSAGGVWPGGRGRGNGAEAPRGKAAPKTLQPERRLSLAHTGRRRSAAPVPSGLGASGF